MAFESFNSLLSTSLYGEPRGWLPLYTMVTFRPDISYATVKKRVDRQSRILTFAGWTGTVVVGMVGLVALRSMRMAASKHLQA